MARARARRAAVDAAGPDAAGHRHLTAALDEVRTALERYAKGRSPKRRGPEKRAADADWASDSGLARVGDTFGLSAFERDTLLLAAGTELDARFAALCADAQGDPTRPYATFSLALAALPDADWEALSPDAPLRYWRLLELGAGTALTTRPLRIDERILHLLAGVDHRDEQLAGLVDPVPVAGGLVPSHERLAERLATAWARTVDTPQFPVVQLCGEETAAKRAIASVACGMLGLGLSRMPADALPTAAADLADLIRLWRREALISDSVLLVDCDDVEPGDGVREGIVRRLLAGVPGALILSGRTRRSPRQRPLLTIDVEKPTEDEQRTVWRQVLGDDQPLADAVNALVSQFDLGDPTIRAAYAGAQGLLGSERAGDDVDAAPAELASALWEACRVQARPRMEDLAQRIVRPAQREHLVLPPLQHQILREIGDQVRWRWRVHHDWGFGERGDRGLGISALFAGVSGTGKTMAAEVLAGELGLDLFRIDLSSVVSKYIGETEKNLQRVFDGAEEGGAILLFDEADALFGKRSEVKDSHDRYANIEVSYLLQRMESYRGLAILTSNLREALDTAFLRRLRFIVEFPFPNAAQRAEIWRRVFPSDLPTDGLDPESLAQLNVAGGSIRNIALNASFLAAAAGEAVTMGHLLRSARREYEKLGKPLPASEVRGWAG